MRRMLCALLGAMLLMGAGMMLAGCEEKEKKPNYALRDLEQSEKLTKENYAKISKGMTIEEVEQIIGKGTKTGKSIADDGTKCEYYQWAGIHNEWLYLIFYDGLLSRMESYRLEER